MSKICFGKRYTDPDKELLDLHKNTIRLIAWDNAIDCKVFETDKYNKEEIIYGVAKLRNTETDEFIKEVFEIEELKQMISKMKKNECIDIYITSNNKIIEWSKYFSIYYKTKKENFNFIKKYLKNMKSIQG